MFLGREIVCWYSSRFVLCAKEVWVNYCCCHSEGAPAQDWHERLTGLLSELDPLEAICSAPAVRVSRVIARYSSRQSRCVRKTVVIDLKGVAPNCDQTPDVLGKWLIIGCYTFASTDPRLYAGCCDFVVGIATQQI
jgi:hypothetical protein